MEAAGFAARLLMNAVHSPEVVLEIAGLEARSHSCYQLSPLLALCYLLPTLLCTSAVKVNTHETL